MKRIFFLFLLSFSLVVHAQNLVPNPSFEDTAFCPFAFNQIDAANGWINFGNSPDYYNACNQSGLNVPNCQFGFQYAHTGNAMAGLVTYVWQFSPDWPNYREFIGIQLLSPLNTGQQYFMSFFLNFVGYLPGWQKIGADKLGMKFSTTSFSETNPPTLNNFAHLYTDSIYTDTVAWIKISGSFIADSAYSYLMLGNFFDSAQTDTMIFGGPPFGGSLAYYYVDDICVTTDSLFNAEWPDVMEYISTSRSDSKILIYPNPANEFLNIKFNEPVEEINITNSLGQIIYRKKTFAFDIDVPVSQLPAGIFSLTLKSKNNFYYSLLKIIH